MAENQEGEDVEVTHEDLARQFNDLQSHLDNRFDGVEGRLDAMEKKVGANEQYINDQRRALRFGRYALPVMLAVGAWVSGVFDAAANYLDAAADTLRKGKP